MSRKSKIIVCISGIVVITLALLGFTFGFFLTRITGNESSKSIEVVTGDAKIKYTDLSESDIDEIIEPGYEVVKPFTIENIGEGRATYSIYLVNVVNNFNRKEDLTYTLYRTDGIITDTIDKDTDFSEWDTLKENIVYPTTSGSIQSNEIVEDSASYTYALKITYINHPTESQNEDQGKTFSGSINIRATASETNPFAEGTLAYNIVENAINARNGSRFVNTPPSKVAEQISSNDWDLGVEEKIYLNDENILGYSSMEYNLFLCYGAELDPETGEPITDCSQVEEYTSCTEDVEGSYVFDSYTGTAIYVEECDNGKIVSETVKYEKILSSTIDDYGTSYYYRGNVSDNYVNFAGMCWRIVRIAGDGSTKLILEDQYTTCDDNETGTTSVVYTGNWNIGTGNYGYELKNVDSDSSNENIMNYLKPVTSNTSSMVKAFYDFQTTKLADYTSKLKSGDWCLGDTAYTRSVSSGSYTYTLLEEYNYTSSMYYDSYTRLTSGNANGYQPTLKCNGTILDKFATVSGVSSESLMYVSAITADEIVYAGGKYGESNYNYYLMNDYSKDIYGFWSFSPSYFYDYVSIDRAFIVSNNGSMSDELVREYASGRFRPSVSLKSGISVTRGNGTLEKPYIIG